MSRISTIRVVGAACVATAVALFAATAVRANIYFDFTDATTGARTANVTSSQTSFTLDVYALITPNGTNVADNTKLGLTAIAGGFMTNSPELRGDVTFGSWNSTPPMSINALASQAGQAFTSTYGALGLGSSTTSTGATQTAWYIASETNLNQTGGTVLSVGGVNLGVEYLLGTIHVDFGGHALPAASTTASMVAIPDYGNAAAKKYQFIQDGVSQSVQGSNALVGGGASSTNIVYSNAAAGITPMSFVFNAGTTTNPAQLGATLSLVSGQTSGYSGDLLGLTGSVTNPATPPALDLNWSQSGLPTGSTLTPASGTVAAGAATPLSGSLKIAGGVFGSVSTPVTFTGTDSASDAIPAVQQTLTYSVTGLATKSDTDGNGVPGGPYGPMLTAIVPQGGSLAGLTTTLGTKGDTSTAIGHTTAQILASLNTSGGTVTEAWRSRSNGELPQNSASAVGKLPLYSDIVDLNGVIGTAGTASTYALQMSYDPAQLGLSAGTAASNGFIYLGSRDPQSGKWMNATSTDAGNSAPGAFAQTNVQGDWASFWAAQSGAGHTLAQVLGSWGVDSTNHMAWAVVDHNSEFGVVPEPGTLALLAAGVAAVGFAFRRRKVAKA